MYTSYICVSVYVRVCGSQTSPHEQDVTQGQFLSGVWYVWIQSFPSPRLVAIPKLKNPAYTTIQPELEEELLDSCLFWVCKRYVICR